jgi:hypothetical protein
VCVCVCRVCIVCVCAWCVCVMCVCVCEFVCTLIMSPLGLSLRDSGPF